jgi:hypothetical protein
MVVISLPSKKDQRHHFKRFKPLQRLLKNVPTGYWVGGVGLLLIGALYLYFSYGTIVAFRSEIVKHNFHNDFLCSVLGEEIYLGAGEHECVVIRQDVCELAGGEVTAYGCIMHTGKPRYPGDF